MTIEIHQPELEALIQERMETSAFANVEEVILQALRAALKPEQPVKLSGRIANLGPARA